MRILTRTRDNELMLLEANEVVTNVTEDLQLLIIYTGDDTPHDIYCKHFEGASMESICDRLYAALDYGLHYGYIDLSSNDDWGYFDEIADGMVNLDEGELEYLENDINATKEIYEQLKQEQEESDEKHV